MPYPCEIIPTHRPIEHGDLQGFSRAQEATFTSGEVVGESIRRKQVQSICRDFKPTPGLEPGPLHCETSGNVRPGPRVSILSGLDRPERPGTDWAGHGKRPQNAPSGVTMHNGRATHHHDHDVSHGRRDELGTTRRSCTPARPPASRREQATAGAGRRTACGRRILRSRIVHSGLLDEAKLRGLDGQSVSAGEFTDQLEEFVRQALWPAAVSATRAGRDGWRRREARRWPASRHPSAR
jgi:hypothetical protein